MTAALKVGTSSIPDDRPIMITTVRIMNRHVQRSYSELSTNLPIWVVEADRRGGLRRRRSL
jgi:hypothetical protein